jgi:CP family cyanate transporter-like MFS transporter
MVVAMILTALTMRVAVTSVGAVLRDLESGLKISSGVGGVITTLPVVCFAVIGSLAPRLAHRFGEHGIMVAALTATTLGLALRAVAGSVWLFAVLSVLALAGGAISNVLIPVLVDRHFPDRIGIMTAAYTTALAFGATAAAGLTVPIANVPGENNWRLGLGSWALLSAVAVLPWLSKLRSDRPDPDTPMRLSPALLLRSRTAWALTLFFAFLSVQAYIAFGWFAQFLRDAGIDAARAGLLIAFYLALSIPVSMAIPILAVRGQRVLIVALSLSSAVAYAGMVIAPVGGAWIWMLFGGIGSGSFPLALTMIGLRTREVASTAALSAFVQGIGYLLAATGPLLVGVLLGATHSWTWPFVVLFTALALSSGAGWYASKAHYVDDELNGAVRRRAPPTDRPRPRLP